MSLFNWFSRKSDGASEPANSDSSGLPDSRGRPLATRDRAQPLNASRPVADPANRSETRKARRHARREQLFVAVREAMTRAGVLAASYKFKVLSLDQVGDQFLVMMDVDMSLGQEPERLIEIEAIIVQTAKARFELLVSSVYWRMEAKEAAPPAKRSGPGMALPDKGGPPDAPVKLRSTPRYDPIQDDEVAAFKQALVAASGTSRVVVDASGKSRSGAHSYTLLTGFEDTEMPESAAAPALSATQYGDLN